ncbi:MAG: CynX/NimT family MFS transporter [Hyphomicrobiaceae bacterium]
MLTNRWAVLALLFAVRTGMGLQFQAVPALSPLFMTDFAITVADIGLLVGLYHAPGLALALPGGAISQRIGDKAAVLLGLAMMIAGGLIMALAPSWTWQIGGRVVAGVGGILLNVVMTKMVADWFAGKEIATAMGVFVNSWPVGIGLGLVLLPWLAGDGRLQLPLLAVVAYLAVCLLALAILYRTPVAANVASGSGPQPAWPAGRALLAVLTAGLVWGLYNAGFGVVFGFGPLMLGERGLSLQAATAMLSVTLWVFALSVPAGGLLADWTGRPLAVLFGGLVAFAAVLALAVRVEPSVLLFALLGFVGGFPAGPIMSLPARVLAPSTRAIGMGLFFTVFYAAQWAGPWLAGLSAALAGSSRATFDLGAALIILCGGALVLFLSLSRPMAVLSAK